MIYTMYVEKDLMGDQVGTFPDLPDCVVEGDSMDELMAAVQETVEAWAAERGLNALPPASDAEPDFSDPQRMPLLVEVDEAFLQG